MSTADERLGGCCQWVLDTVCQTVEWLHQPLGFDSLALLLGHSTYRKQLDRIYGCIIIEVFGRQRPVPCFRPRLMTGALAFWKRSVYPRISHQPLQLCHSEPSAARSGEKPALSESKGVEEPAFASPSLGREFFLTLETRIRIRLQPYRYSLNKGPALDAGERFVSPNSLLLSQYSFGERHANLEDSTERSQYTLPARDGDKSCPDRWIARDFFLMAARFSRGRLTFAFTTRFMTVCRSLANSVFVFSAFTLKPSSSTIL